MDALTEWLKANPQVVGSPWSRAERQVEEAELWRDVPDTRCCHCCNGTGLVSDEAVKRFINPEYDPVLSPPIRCLRSPICGIERVPVSNDNSHSMLERRRFEHRTELPELPRPVADRIHQTLKAERREMALSPARAERLDAVKAQARAGLRGLTRGSRPLPVPADE